MHSIWLNIFDFIKTKSHFFSFSKHVFSILGLGKRKKIVWCQSILASFPCNYLQLQVRQTILNSQLLFLLLIRSPHVGLFNLTYVGWQSFSCFMYVKSYTVKTPLIWTVFSFTEESSSTFYPDLKQTTQLYSN